jgi:hypothetical protein
VLKPHSVARRADFLEEEEREEDTEAGIKRGKTIYKMRRTNILERSGENKDKSGE